MKLKLLFHLIIVVCLLTGKGITNEMSSFGSGENITITAGGIYDNDNPTCAERTLPLSETPSPYSSAVDIAVRAFRIIFVTLLIVISLFLNSLVVYLVAKHKKLQTLSFGIALQFAIMDILVAASQLLSILVTSIADKWVLGSQVCVAVGFISILLYIIRGGIMLVFIIDRFMSVFFPFFYPRHKVKVAVALSVSIWVLASVLQILSLPNILDCIGFLRNLNTCALTTLCDRPCTIQVNLVVALVLMFAAIVPAILHTALYLKAKSLHKNTATISSPETEERERRATITFFLFFVSLFMVLVPTSIIAAIITQLSRSYEVLPPGFYVTDVISVTFTSLLVLTDPLVIMRHSDVREILSEMKASLKQKLCGGPL